MKPVTSTYKASTIAYKMPFDSFPKDDVAHDFLQRTIQQHNHARVPHDFAVHVAQHQAAAGGYDASLLPRQLNEHIRLRVAERLLAVVGENVAGGTADRLLNALVGVDEGQTKVAGDTAAQRAFAASRHPDDVDVSIKHGSPPEAAFPAPGG